MESENYRGRPELASLLFPPSAGGIGQALETNDPLSADSLHDLGLESLDAQLAKLLVPRLKRVFATPLPGIDAVGYRQEVFADLANPQVHEAAQRFLDGMKRVRTLRGRREDASYAQTFDIWDVHAGASYIKTIDELDQDLGDCLNTGDLTSRALVALRCYVTDYAESPEFCRLRDDTRRAEHVLDQLQYALWVRDNGVVVGYPGHEPDLERHVVDLFARFRDDSSQEPSELRRPLAGGVDHVQAAILSLVKRLNPGTFEQAGAVAAEVRNAVPDPELVTAAEELTFYLSIDALLAPARRAGMPLCLPDVTVAPGLEAHASWDVALGLSLAVNGRVPVTNDLELGGDERILVISGPNQGGKTTTARTFGQLHHLAAVGCPVPGSRVRIMLTDKVLTVFERQETAADFNGRLGGELQRWHQTLDAATPHSAVVINEIFSSAPLADARVLGRTLIDQIVALGAPAVVVTFLDELSRVGPRTVSMVSTVDAEDPTRRTLKVIRRAADGRAYAMSLARRYGISSRQIAERIAS